MVLGRTRAHFGRSNALHNGKPHGTDLIGRMKGLLPKRCDEQFHQIPADVPGISRFLEFEESIAFMPRHFQDIFAERNG